MQANVGVSEPAAAIAVGGGGGPGAGSEDSLPELAGSNSNLAPIQAVQSQPPSIRATSSSSSGQHHPQQQSNQGTAGVGLLQQPNQLEPAPGGVHHRGGYHSQRQPYHGHLRQHHMQPYQQQQHHHHHPNLHQHHNHQHLNKYHNNPRGDNESNVNHVLLITVINAHYSITCDLIHQICSTYGKVNRIVIFKKNGVQAMVEFDNVESAKRAKAMLYGCDIYSGCCTLKIEYAKPTRLNVHKNDTDSFDYTILNLGGDPATSQQHAVGTNVDVDHQQQPHNQLPMVPSDSAPAHHLMAHHPNHGSQNHHHGGGVGPTGRGGAGGHHMGSQHINPSQAHSQSNAAGSGVGQQQDSYASNLSNQQPTSTNDSFQQDGGFNGSRTQGPPQGPPYVDSYGHNVPHIGLHSNNMYSRQDGQQQQHHHHGHHHHPRPSLNLGPNHGSAFSSNNTSNAIMGGGPTNHHHHHHHHSLHSPQGAVMMVYGLEPGRFNCDRLFNLFCLYGNVVRVKFLKTKEGCAMVQMGDALAVDWCVDSLHKITLFDSELQISYSKQAFLHDVIQPFILPDGSPSFKDFTRNNNNRFKNPEVASKNRILPPSQVLHFFNAPFGISEDELVHLFKQTTDHEPVSVKIFTPKVENSKSFTGLVTFKDITEATEALIICNHMSMPKHGVPHPYILRLCFSPPIYNRPQQVPPSGKIDMSGR